MEGLKRLLGRVGALIHRRDLPKYDPYEAQVLNHQIEEQLRQHEHWW